MCPVLSAPATPCVPSPAQKRDAPRRMLHHAAPPNSHENNSKAEKQMSSEDRIGGDYKGLNDNKRGGW